MGDINERILEEIPESIIGNSWINLEGFSEVIVGVISVRFLGGISSGILLKSVKELGNRSAQSVEYAQSTTAELASPTWRYSDVHQK